MERLEIKARVSIDDAGTVTGIAWPFSKPDSIGDLIEPTAFKFAPQVPMLIEHDGRQVVGIWNDLAVTDKGLEVKGRLFVEGVAPASKARRYLKSGIMSGLSIGYMNNGFKARPEGGRVLTDITVAEISLCKRPIHPDARTIEVKSAAGGAANDIFKDFSKMGNEQIETPEVETKSENPVDQKAFDAMKARLDKLEAKANRPQPSNSNHPRAGNDNGLDAEIRGALLEKKALTISAPGTAGNLAWDEFSTTILEKLRPSSPVRQLARVVNVGSALLQIPRLVNRVKPGSVGETDQKPESEPSFEQIDIKNFAMGVVTPVSRTALEDTNVNLVSYLQDHIISEFGTLENEWFITGNGTTQAEGVLTSTEVEAIEAAAIDADSLLDIYYGVKSGYAINAAWLMNRKTMRIVRGLRDSDGNLLWQPGLQAGQPGLLLGKPVYECDFMPDAGEAETPIIFGDFQRGYTITDRVSFEPNVDYNTRFGEDIVVFGGRRRVGGKVVMGEALIKLKIAA
ncbi:phage major capsid protein [Brucella sp. 6810]|uniref:phage major capsid protein n=1 Tax=unclassified Brucella TaxID=2632610 RepID=UPI00084F9A6F|nr:MULTISPECIES: phage major capsid protein [unclassified Brucella]OEI84571.1 capsid protein [Brucella sp. B13-0095]QMV26849.1 phage major capsid protein [Brucella sp. BO3]QNQ63111.1 phage major capsid protein [Brucella sp. 6810]